MWRRLEEEFRPLSSASLNVSNLGYSVDPNAKANGSQCESNHDSRKAPKEKADKGGGDY